MLNDEKDSSSSSESKEKEGGFNFDLKKVIFIRAEHLLNITLTKSTLDLGQRIQKLFNDAYKNGSSSDDDQQQEILAVLNQY